MGHVHMNAGSLGAQKWTTGSPAAGVPGGYKPP